MAKTKLAERMGCAALDALLTRFCWSWREWYCSAAVLLLAAMAPAPNPILRPFVFPCQGDPSAAPYAVENAKTILGKKPVFGICMGHQVCTGSKAVAGTRCVSGCMCTTQSSGGQAQTTAPGNDPCKHTAGVRVVVLVQQVRGLGRHKGSLHCTWGASDTLDRKGHSRYRAKRHQYERLNRSFRRVMEGWEGSWWSSCSPQFDAWPRVLKLLGPDRGMQPQCSTRHGRS